MTEALTETRAPDPAWFELGETGEFWFELVVRNADGTRETRLTEVEGHVSGAPSVRLTEADLDQALTSTLRHLAEVIEDQPPRDLRALLRLGVRHGLTLGWRPGGSGSGYWHAALPDWEWQVFVARHCRGWSVELTGPTGTVRLSDATLESVWAGLVALLGEQRLAELLAT